MERRATGIPGRESVREPDHQGPLEGPEHDPARMLRCDERRRRHDIKIVEPPGFLLEILDRVVLSFALDIADVETPTVNVPFEHTLPAFSSASRRDLSRSRLGMSPV